MFWYEIHLISKCISEQELKFLRLYSPIKFKKIKTVTSNRLRILLKWSSVEGHELIGNKRDFNHLTTSVKLFRRNRHD